MLTVISGGKATRIKAAYPFPVRETTATAAPVQGVTLLRNGLYAAYDAIVRTQPWVYAAVNKIAFGMARIPMKVYDDEFSDSRKRVYDVGPAPLFKRPSERTRWPSLALEWYWDYLVWGKGLLVKWRTTPGAPPDEIWYVPWRYVRELVDEAGAVVTYEVYLGGKRYPVTPSETVVISYPKGIPPLQALARTVAIEDAALTYAAEALDTGLTPRAAFSTPDALNTGDFDRLREELHKIYSTAGDFAILHKGLEYKGSIGVSAVDLALIDQRKLSREEVAAAFDVSPPFLGILERATFNNIEELRESQYVDSLGPKLEQVQAVLQAQLIDCEPAWETMNYWVEPDMGAILKPNPEGQARQSLMEQQSSLNSIDERRRIRNQPPFGIKGVTDVPLIPVNMRPAQEGMFDTPDPVEQQSAEPHINQDLTTEAFRGPKRGTTGQPPSEE